VAPDGGFSRTKKSVILIYEIIGYSAGTKVIIGSGFENKAS